MEAEALEDRKIVVEFMGLKPKMEAPDVYSYSDYPYFYVRENNPEKVLQSIIKYVKYDSDWNWTMQLLEKIYALSGTDKPYYGISFTMHNDTFQFGTDNQIVDGLNKHISSKNNNLTRIKVVYKACVEFLKWYKQQELIIAIERGDINTEELKNEFSDTLYVLGYAQEIIEEYVDEHFQNLLSFKENKNLFVKWLYNRKI